MEYQEILGNSMEYQGIPERKKPQGIPENSREFVYVTQKIGYNTYDFIKKL